MSSLPNSNSCAGTSGASPTNPGLELTTEQREVNLVNSRKVAECYQRSLTLTRQLEEVGGLPELPEPQPFKVQFDVVHSGDADCYEADFDSFPVGYRFCPTDQELIVHYLKKKVMEEKLPPHKFKQINIYKYNPEELAAMFTAHREKEFYFFTPRDKKYPKGNRPNRAAGGGYWKATGADKKIKLEGKEVGSKKSLVFYRGKPPHGEKANWIMQEYRVKNPPPSKRDENDMRLDKWVLCKIYQKVDKSLREKSKEKPSTSFCQEYNTDAVMEPVESATAYDQRTPEGAEDYQAWNLSRFDAEAQYYQAFKPSRFNAEAQYYQAFKPSRFNAAGPVDYQALKPSHFNAAGAVDYQASKPSHFNAEAGAETEEYQKFNFTYPFGAGADADALNPSFWTSPDMEILKSALHPIDEDIWEKPFSSGNLENSQSLIEKPYRL